ncbi:HK97 family phage prohead protease [Lacticaseibacillus yichunensis]|uniref:HK97 family phage prohead protease n=1 Tax=Lacticaseibacillus yichunensis TaxID=2486015 RepID=A0ABW4CKD9_9LACO|nr:HK97 family phage prohead protease [Lacticaseibacillus yichunensis]
MKEIRMMTTPIELRDAEEGKSQAITGYALKFNRQSDPLGYGDYRFRETIDPHALDNADLSNVVALFNHDQSQVLGRTGINLTLTVDEVGLRYELTPLDTQLSHDLVENIRSGVVSQSSFAFTIPDDTDADKWTRDGDAEAPYNRLIRSIDHIYDVSPVTTPAYPDTEVKVGARSLEEINKLDQPPKWQEDRDALVKQLKREQITEGL